MPVPPFAMAGRRAVAIDLLLASVVGALAYALSCWLVPPHHELAGFGIQWQMMAAAPLELRGQLPHRILMPLLASWCGCGGPQEFVLFVRGLTVLLLLVVCFFCRRRGATVVDAALITVAVALTAAVQMYKWHWVGYADPLLYALFFIAWLCADRPVVFWLLFFLNLLTHELAAFLLPWLLFVRHQATGLGWRDAVLAPLLLAGYAGFYLWVKAHAPQQLFSADYFAEHPLFPGGAFAVWILVLTHYVLAFGPILAVLAWHQHTGRHGRERLHLWLCGVGIFVIHCIAFDWQRHANLVILPLALASMRFLAAGHRLAYAALVVSGAAAMVWLPPWAAKSWPTHVLVDLAIERKVVLLNTDSNQVLHVTFGPLGNTLRNWLPAAWPTLWPMLVALAAIWVAGALWTRRRRAMPA